MNWVGKCTTADEVEEIRRLTKLLANAQGAQTPTTGVNGAETDTITRTADEPLRTVDTTHETPCLYRIDNNEPPTIMQDLPLPDTHYGGPDNAPAPNMPLPDPPHTCASGGFPEFPSLPHPNPAASGTHEPSIDSPTVISSSPIGNVSGLSPSTGRQNCPHQVDHTNSSSTPVLQPAIAAPSHPGNNVLNEPSINSSLDISDSPVVIIPGPDLSTGRHNSPHQVDHTNFHSAPVPQPADPEPSQPESIVPDDLQGPSTVKRQGRPRKSEEEKQKAEANKRKFAEQRKKAAREKKVAGEKKKAAGKKKGSGEKENEERTEVNVNVQQALLHDPLSETAHTSQLQHGNAPVNLTAFQSTGSSLTPTAPLAPPPSSSTPPTAPLPPAAFEQSIPSAEPEWTVEAEAFLRKHLKGPNTQHLVSQWLAFEAALGYPNGKVNNYHASFAKLNTTDSCTSIQNKIVSKEPLPNPLQVWLKNKKRTFAKSPDIPPTLELSVAFRRWYTGFQPQWRRNLAIWPLSRDNAAHPDEPWYLLKCGGQNGFVLILLCLAWWCRGLQSIAEQKGFDIAVDDVLWTLNTILESIGGGSKLGKRRRTTGAALAAVRTKRDANKNEPQPKRRK